MSWVIIDKSTVGNTQYVNASYSTNISPDDSGINSSFFKVLGYTKGTISYQISDFSATNLKVILQGSNDGTNYFDFNASNTHTTSNLGNMSWHISVKFIRINAKTTGDSGTNTLSRLYLLAVAGGSGGSSGDGIASSSFPIPGGTNKQIQFNDAGVFGGASGFLYDKTINTNTGQLQLTEGTVALPVISFSDGTHPAGNYDTGIYKVGADQIGFSAGGSLQVGISSIGVSVDDGSISIPGINFGASGDTNTGFYRPASNTIGFSTNSVEKVSIYPSDSGEFIEGLNIGTTSNIAGIRRLSASGTNSWEDGYLGNSGFIVFTARDFKSATNAGITFYGNSDNGLNSAMTSEDVGVVAQAIIPKGFEINPEAEFIIYSDATVSDAFLFRVKTGNIGAPGGVSNTRFNDNTVGTNVLHTLNGTGPDVGDGVNTVLILWDPGAIITTTTAILGAKIQISRV